jgi:hypothetical protein
MQKTDGFRHPFYPNITIRPLKSGKNNQGNLENTELQGEKRWLLLNV